MNDVHLPSLDTVEAGAPANEIEITEEMISAGAEVLWREDRLLDIGQGSAEALTELILRRALAVSPGKTQTIVG